MIRSIKVLKLQSVQRFQKKKAANSNQELGVSCCKQLMGSCGDAGNPSAAARSNALLCIAWNGKNENPVHLRQRFIHLLDQVIKTNYLLNSHSPMGE